LSVAVAGTRVTSIVVNEFSSFSEGARMSWASVQECADITGITVTTTELLQAQGAIEVHANRVQSTAFDATCTARDLAWLKRAVAWQAAWLTEQVDFATRSAYSQLSQDSTQHVTRAASEVVLAPLAARALKNVSWKGSRSIVIRPAYRRRGEARPGGTNLLDYTQDSSDDQHSWDSL
jgi:hypothetical protein